METTQDAEAEVAQKERRDSQRRKVTQPIRIQPLDVKDGYFDEITTTLDNCRHGISFASRLAVFYMGMGVRVAYPYTATVKVNHVGKVIRIEKLDANFQRIVIKLE